MGLAWDLGPNFLGSLAGWGMGLRFFFFLSFFLVFFSFFPPPHLMVSGGLRVLVGIEKRMGEGGGPASGSPARWA